ncbi:hypothetical protein [Vreelandella sedimenti]|nr:MULTISPECIES: hypothetical protein [Halomonas]
MTDPVKQIAVLVVLANWPVLGLTLADCNTQRRWPHRRRAV